MLIKKKMNDNSSTLDNLKSLHRQINELDSPRVIKSKRKFLENDTMISSKLSNKDSNKMQISLRIPFKKNYSQKDIIKKTSLIEFRKISSSRNTIELSQIQKNASIDQQSHFSSFISPNQSSFPQGEEMLTKYKLIRSFNIIPQRSCSIIKKRNNDKMPTCLQNSLLSQVDHKINNRRFPQSLSFEKKHQIRSYSCSPLKLVRARFNKIIKPPLGKKINPLIRKPYLWMAEEKPKYINNNCDNINEQAYLYHIRSSRTEKIVSSLNKYKTLKTKNYHRNRPIGASCSNLFNNDEYINSIIKDNHSTKIFQLY